MPESEDQKRSEETVVWTPDAWLCPAGLRGLHVDMGSVTMDVARAIADARAEGHAAGYAEAVAYLRDGDRYRDWWTAHPDQQFGTAYWAPDGRRHLADYLETVGPDGLDVTRSTESGEG